MSNEVDIPEFQKRDNQNFFLFSGPCVIESKDMALETASELKEITDRLEIDFIYKSSFDKANRTSHKSHRGPGRKEGLEILSQVRNEIGVPVITDVHSVEDIHEASELVDVLQIPAFLCRQTDLLEAAAVSGKPINIKKGQFLSHFEMEHVARKVQNANPRCELMLCERGNSFGYNNLVVDMRGLQILKSFGYPVVFDATHSVQLPGAAVGKSGGQREFIPTLARAALAVGIDGLFMETHPDPERALSDGPNSWPLQQMESLLGQLIKIDALTRSFINLDAEEF
ncbi:MAG: 3-deoxy-8-phosphooctulonate synthase [Gammaproteobacteria bacterium]|nr:3-deoxy-8-phosphooctulonate synthase [Gammaproteobacteria bacterium]